MRGSHIVSPLTCDNVRREVLPWCIKRPCGARSPQIPQLARGRAAMQAKHGRTAPARMLASGTGRAATRGGAPVIELECGITVYPAREEQGRGRAAGSGA